MTDASAARRTGVDDPDDGVMGSPLYMSPEQMQSSKDVDARTDIWALGVILFELVTSDFPRGRGHPGLAVNVWRTASAGRLRPDAPPGLEEVVQRCLEKERDKRYANVAELAQALLGLAPKRGAHSVDSIVRIIGSAGLSTSAPPPAAASSEALPPPRLTAPTMPSWGHKTAPRSLRRTAALISIAAVTALAGVLADGRGDEEIRPRFGGDGRHHALLDPDTRRSRGVPSVRSPGSSSEAAPFETLSTPEAPKARAAPSASMTSAAVRSGVPAKVGSSAKPACSSVPDFDSEGNIVYQQVCQ